MSAEAIAQRRSAAWKHGQRAESLLAQIVPPCKKSLCPMNDPEEKGACGVKRAMEEQDKPLSICPVQLVGNEDVKRKLLAAMDGDLSGYQDLTANLLAGIHGVAVDEVAKLAKQGLTIDQPIVNSDGDVSGYITRVNPAAEPLTKILTDVLGVSAREHAMTPKSRGERARDEGIDELAALLAGRVTKRREIEQSANGTPKP